MRRIKGACLEQTIHFKLKEDMEPKEAARMAKEEYEHYRLQMERKHVRYKIVSEKTLEDGSIVIQIKKQYNNYDCGDYLA